MVVRKLAISLIGSISITVTIAQVKFKHIFYDEKWNKQQQCRSKKDQTNTTSQEDLTERHPNRRKTIARRRRTHNNTASSQLN